MPLLQPFSCRKRRRRCGPHRPTEIVEVSRKMLDTASETQALPFEEAASSSTIHNLSNSRLLAFIRGLTPLPLPNNKSPLSNNSSSALAVKYSAKNRRCEATSPYRI